MIIPVFLSEPSTSLFHRKLQCKNGNDKNNDDDEEEDDERVSNDVDDGHALFQCWW